MYSLETVRLDALRRCRHLAKQLGTNTAVIDSLVPHGLSESWLVKFMNETGSNPTIQKLDTLLEALTKVEDGIHRQ
jgi:hypothetical protein